MYFVLCIYYRVYNHEVFQFLLSSLLVIETNVYDVSNETQIEYY
jgi:hypothetical protein